MDIVCAFTGVDHVQVRADAHDVDSSAIPLPPCISVRLRGFAEVTTAVASSLTAALSENVSICTVPTPTRIDALLLFVY